MNTLKGIHGFFRQSSPVIFKSAKLVLFILILLTNSPYCFSQSTKIDSLLQDLMTFEEDTNKASALIFLGQEYAKSGDYIRSRKYHLDALQLSEKINFENGMFLASTDIGITFLNQGNYPEALKYFIAALSISEASKNLKHIAKCYNNIGVVYKNQGNYPEALIYFLRNLEISTEIGDKRGIASAYNNIGLVYENSENSQEALKNYQASLKIREEIGDKRGIASNYNNIAIINYRKGDYPQALTNFMASLKIREEMGDKNGMSTAYLNVGNVYIRLNSFSESRIYLNKGLALSQEIGALDRIKTSYFVLSRLDSAMKDYKLALFHYQLYSDYKDSIYNKSNSKLIAEMKEKYESEKKDNEIIKLESENQKLESETQIKALLLTNKQDSLSIIQAENDMVRLQNEKMKALSLYNLQQIDLLNNEKQIQHLQIAKDRADLIAQKAKADKKQEQLVVLNKEKTIQHLELNKQRQAKNYFIALLGLFIILSLFAYRNYRIHQDLKLQTLRIKIASDLHDEVGSTLSSIAIFSEVAQQQTKEVIPLLFTINESARKMLDAMADIVWTINPENDQFEKIILRMRSFAYELLGAKKIEFRFDADEDITKLKLPMSARKNLYLIFKEATNNMAKYADASYASFAINGSKDSLCMVISDNGKGFDLNKQISGNGLKNMRARAEEIGAKLLIESVPGNGTTIQLLLNLA